VTGFDTGDALRSAGARNGERDVERDVEREEVKKNILPIYISEIIIERYK